jgi:hypothetical protein
MRLMARLTNILFPSSSRLPRRTQATHKRCRDLPIRIVDNCAQSQTRRSIGPDFYRMSKLCFKRSATITV